MRVGRYRVTAEPMTRGAGLDAMVHADWDVIVFLVALGKAWRQVDVMRIIGRFV
jgi:hypothetical protein